MKFISEEALKTMFIDRLGYREFTPSGLGRQVICLVKKSPAWKMIILVDHVWNDYKSEYMNEHYYNLIKGQLDIPMENVLFIYHGSRKALKAKGKNVIGLNRDNYREKHNVTEYFMEEQRELTAMCKARRKADDVVLRAEYGTAIAPVSSWLHMVLCILLVFIYMQRPEIVKYALTSDAVATKPLQLVTYMFVHSGFAHIAGNTISLFILGRALERRRGALCLGFMFIMGGVMAGVASAMYGTVFGINATVGASGAIFAILGAYMMDVILNDENDKKYIIGYAIYMLIVNSYGTNVNWLAHAAGFLAGMILMYCYRGTIEMRDFSMIMKYKKANTPAEYFAETPKTACMIFYQASHSK